MTHPTPTGPSQPPPPPRDAEHELRSGWTGGPGECGASCACGVTFDGFDSLGEATKLLDEHVAAPAVAQVLDEADGILAGPLPRLGEVIRDAERYGAQMLAVLGRQYDPESAPEGDVWAGMPVADFSLAVAVSSVRTALAALADLASRPLPVAGSAVKFPARQDPVTVTPVPRIATTDGPDQTTRAPAGEEPTPDSAVDAVTSARESAGVATPGAGASSGPSPRRDDDTPPGNDVRRGAGPGYLGPAVKFRVAKCGQLSVHGPHDVEHGPDQPRSCPGVRVP